EPSCPGQTSDGLSPRWSAPFRPCSWARLRLIRRKLRSVPKKAKPIGASRSRVASSAESETSIPDTRGCGTDVSVLIAPALARERACHPRLLPAHSGLKQAIGISTAAGGNHPHRGAEPSAGCHTHHDGRLVRLPHPRPHRVRR